MIVPKLPSGHRILGCFPDPSLLTIQILTKTYFPSLPPFPPPPKQNNRSEVQSAGFYCLLPTGQVATAVGCRAAPFSQVDYLSTVTLPLRTGRESTGSDTRIGLNWNLQPKQSAESLKKDTDTMGRSKMWMGST